MDHPLRTLLRELFIDPVVMLFRRAIRVVAGSFRA